MEEAIGLHIKRHYYVTHRSINPTQIVPVGPDLGLAAPHARTALAGEWHLDSIAGGTTPDTSGHGYTGHVVGSPTTVPDGRFNGALHFPTKGSAINAGNFADLQPANVSVLAWVRSSSVPATVKNIVAQGGQDSCSFASYALYTGGSSQASGVRFYVHTNTSTYVAQPGSGSACPRSRPSGSSRSRSRCRRRADRRQAGSAARCGWFAHSLTVPKPDVACPNRMWPCLLTAPTAVVSRRV